MRLATYEERLIGQGVWGLSMLSTQLGEAKSTNYSGADIRLVFGHPNPNIALEPGSSPHPSFL